LCLLRFALLRSAKPCSLSRFFKYRQTFFAFNFFVGQRLSEETLRVRFSGAFDYDSVLATSSTIFWLFFHPAWQAFQPALPTHNGCCVLSEAHEYMPKFRPGKPVAEKLRAKSQGPRALRREEASAPLG
jgi:hypothetical protein